MSKKLARRCAFAKLSIVQLCGGTEGLQPKGLLKQSFLCVLNHKQKCLLARAFLRRPSIAQLRKAQVGEARRFAKARLPVRIIPCRIADVKEWETFTIGFYGNICI